MRKKNHLIVFNKFTDYTEQLAHSIANKYGHATSMDFASYNQLEPSQVADLLNDYDGIIIIQPTEEMFMLAGQANYARIPTVLLQEDVGLGLKAISESLFVRSLSLFTPMEAIIETLDELYSKTLTKFPTPRKLPN